MAVGFFAEEPVQAEDVVAPIIDDIVGLAVDQVENVEGENQDEITPGGAVVVPAEDPEVQPDEEAPVEEEQKEDEPPAESVKSVPPVVPVEEETPGEPSV